MKVLLDLADLAWHTWQLHLSDPFCPPLLLTARRRHWALARAITKATSIYNYNYKDFFFILGAPSQHESWLAQVTKTTRDTCFRRLSTSFLAFTCVWIHCSPSSCKETCCSWLSKVHLHEPRRLDSRTATKRARHKQFIKVKTPIEKYDRVDRLGKPGLLKIVLQHPLLIGEPKQRRVEPLQVSTSTLPPTTGKQHYQTVAGSSVFFILAFYCSMQIWIIPVLEGQELWCLLEDRFLSETNWLSEVSDYII